MEGNREYKSDVFGMLMEYPKYALQVYNALNDTHINDTSLITMKRLNKGISLSVRNDAAFIVDSEFNLYEHQSTYNPNMPLRCLFYYSNSIGDYIKDYDLYGRRLIRIPSPRFVVFYNGIENRPEREIMYLSSAFEKVMDNPELEIKVTVLNINCDNTEFLRKCDVLREYMQLMNLIYCKASEGKTTEASIKESIDECISRNILKEFLVNRRNEVEKVMTIDMTWERREQLIRRDERAEGLELGKEIGKEIGMEILLVEQITKKLEKEKSISIIAEELEITEEYVQQIIEKNNLR